MAKNAEHLDLGREGEDAAARFLTAKGLKIVARNWRPTGAHQGLELDIVARRGDTLIFVEVKTRSAADGASLNIPAHAAFTRQKQARLARAAGLYLSAHDVWELPCRFDLVCVERLADGRLCLEHHTHVIELGHFVDSGHAAW